MSRDEVKELKQSVKELTEAVNAVNERIQLWTDADYNWKKEEREKRNQLEVATKPLIEFFDDWSRTKKVILWVVGGLSAAIGFYLLVYEALKTIITK